MSVSRQRLVDALAASVATVAGLERDRARVVAASEASNADDEHDPEGSTIAFEREQLTALLDQALRTRAELDHALSRLEHGTYGTCERCGETIAAARLEARPTARTCIDCAAATQRRISRRCPDRPPRSPR